MMDSTTLMSDRVANEQLCAEVEKLQRENTELKTRVEELEEFIGRVADGELQTMADVLRYADKAKEPLK